ncbi:hypothetical protein FDECE_6423 [Fusarium decemcellulare]|nr:hypothetical protein FDECE_6423 [Fusarium decemcellulare]
MLHDATAETPVPGQFGGLENGPLGLACYSVGATLSLKRPGPGPTWASLGVATWQWADIRLETPRPPSPRNQDKAATRPHLGMDPSETGRGHEEKGREETDMPRSWQQRMVGRQWQADLQRSTGTCRNVKKFDF